MAPLKSVILVAFSCLIPLAASKAQLEDSLGLQAPLAAAVDKDNAAALAAPIDAVVQEEQTEYDCKHPPLRPYLISSSPLVLYLEGFLTPEERSQLLTITNGTFSRSRVAFGNGDYGPTSARTSQSAFLPRDPPVVQCITRRAAALQGITGSFSSPPPSSSSSSSSDDEPEALHRVEPLQLVRYDAPNAQFAVHTDWFRAHDVDRISQRAGGNRATSIFAYVAGSDDLVGGGTNFPLLDPDTLVNDKDLCRLVDCDAPRERGVTFRPVVGNAVFWANLVEEGPKSWREEMALAGDKDGSGNENWFGEWKRGSSRKKGDERVLHAGLPVTRGWKVGMNIWTREGPAKQELKKVVEI